MRAWASWHRCIGEELKSMARAISWGPTRREHARATARRCSALSSARTCKRNSEEDGQRFRGLYQGPRSGKVSCSQPFQGQHLEGVKRTAERRAVKPGGQYKSVVTLHAAKRHLSYGFKQRGNPIRAGNPHGLGISTTPGYLRAQLAQFSSLRFPLALYTD